MPRARRLAQLAATAWLTAAAVPAAATPPGLQPGAVPRLSAHNCYPYNGLWTDRIDRALTTGTPVAIEQDLCWITQPEGTEPRSVLSHGDPFDGREPTLRDHFFERIRPAVEAALAAPAPASWPLFVLDLDVKHNTEPHIRAIHATLKAYRPWLTTAAKPGTPGEVTPLVPGPVLVILGGHGPQQTVFFDDVPVGGDIIAFGAARTGSPRIRGTTDEERALALATCPPSDLVNEPASAFRRWWNNPWAVIEAGGPPNAGEWTAEDDARLRAVVAHGHALGYFVRFYSLNGHSAADSALGGMSPGYNFGSLDAVRPRWEAAARAGVDFIASDQYEQAARAIANARTPAKP